MSGLKGNYQVSQQLYEQAVSQVEKTMKLDEIGIVHERFAEFLAQVNKLDLAAQHIRSAYQIFKNWGASKKLDNLKENFANLFARNSLPWEKSIATNQGNEQASLSTLDGKVLIDAIQAMSEIINLGELLRYVLQKNRCHFRGSKGVYFA